MGVAANHLHRRGLCGHPDTPRRRTCCLDQHQGNRGAKLIIRHWELLRYNLQLRFRANGTRQVHPGTLSGIHCRDYWPPGTDLGDDQSIRDCWGGTKNRDEDDKVRSPAVGLGLQQDSRAAAHAFPQGNSLPYHQMIKFYIPQGSGIWRSNQA